MVDSDASSEGLQRTLALIKPDAIAAGYANAILDKILSSGFTILHRRVLRLTKESAEEFYEEHHGKEFFDALTTFMSSGDIMALALARNDAIKGWRSLMGPTNSDKAREEAPESIRALYGTDGRQNATHGSDSVESANRELKFFFPNMILEPLLAGDAAKEYLKEKVNPTLTSALKALCKEKPSDPITWLGQYLISNNPNKPKVFEPPAPATNKIVFVLGGPGSGKGTQCAKLVEEFGFIHLSAGDLLRAEQASGSANAQKINDYIKNGKIVPKEITISLLKAAMAKHCGVTFLIDGFPRAIDQALEFEEQNGAPHMLLFFECPENVMEERLLNRGKTSGRADDNAESIKKRFTTYQNETMPVIHYYEKTKKVKKVSAADEVDKVYVNTRALFLS